MVGIRVGPRCAGNRSDRRSIRAVRHPSQTMLPAWRLNPPAPRLTWVPSRRAPLRPGARSRQPAEAERAPAQGFSLARHTAGWM